MISRRESHLTREIELHKRLAANYTIRYQDAFSQVFQKEWNRALFTMNQTQADRVLELGCGTGVLLADLKQKHRFVVGSDASREMMQAAWKVGALLVAGDGSTLPFGRASFDLVICRGVLHHVPDRRAALAEIHRVLRPGGEFILSEPSNDWWVVRTIRELMYRFSDKFDEEDEGFLSDQLRNLLETTGFYSGIVRGGPAGPTGPTSHWPVGVDRFRSARPPAPGMPGTDPRSGPGGSRGPRRER